MKVKEKRQKMIMGVLRERHQLTVDELVAMSGRSAETIRRDLGELAELGLVQKIHGGVKLPSMRYEHHYTGRMQQNAEGKGAIGRYLATMIRSGDTIFMDTGSTTYYCAEALKEINGICVITNSIDIASVLGVNSEIEVILIGGKFNALNRQVLGSIAVRDVTNYRPDYAVLTVGAIDHSGIMDFNNEESSLAMAMMNSAYRTIVVADEGKLDRQCAFRICSLNEVHDVISDVALPNQYIHTFEERGVNYHYAKSSSSFIDNQH